MNDRKNCPYRHENGNCLPIGGFCAAVSDEYCEEARKKNDFVSRQWLIDEYHRRHQGPPGGALKMIEEAPAVEPVRHGQWIAKKKNLTEGAAYMIPLTIRYFVCSLCGSEEDNAEPYCNCGAKMDRETQEEADDGE